MFLLDCKLGEGHWCGPGEVAAAEMGTWRGHGWDSKLAQKQLVLFQINTLEALG